jgi:hypothetical protein
MTPERILAHLYTYLPRYTDLFHKNIDNISSIETVASGSGTTTVEVVTSDEHGLDVGDIVGMKEASVATPIVSATCDTSTIEIITDGTHDLTEGYQDTVTFGGFTEAGLNGEKTISEVISATTVDIVMPTECPDVVITGDITPDATGNYYYDGEFEGYPSYKHESGGWYITYAFSGTSSNFVITGYLSNEKGELGATNNIWRKNGDANDATLSNLWGSWGALLNSAGTAAVAEYSIDLTGDEYLLSNRELLAGVFAVTTVSDVNTFQFEVPDSLPIGDIYNAVLYANCRIVACTSLEEAERAYTKQNNVNTPITETGPYLVLVMGDDVASKDPKINSAATAQSRNVSYTRQLYLQNFTLLVILDSTSSQTGTTPQNLIYTDVRYALRKIWHGFTFAADDTVSQIWDVNEISNGLAYYDTARYIHIFQYEIPYEITYIHGFDEVPTVALNKILGDLYIHPRELTADIVEEDNKIEIDAEF